MSFVKIIFFFKQKTAYEISACLVGSEMCIRDSAHTESFTNIGKLFDEKDFIKILSIAFRFFRPNFNICLLYTSDAADEEDSVDLGGRRIIEKKKNTIVWACHSFRRQDTTK
ncbi:hypothetical protein CDFC105_93895 [Clostridioides difficile]|nr:hypothetical protein CDFC105_93895 [Clostridioides difficile]